LGHIGDHLLKRRLDLGLPQKQAAQQLGTDAWSLRNWEANRRAVHIRVFPAIIDFLGYNPLPEARTPGEMVRHERISRGWSRRGLGKRAKVDEATVKRIEEDTPRMTHRAKGRILRLLGIASEGRRLDGPHDVRSADLRRGV
jgi:transcriptional regulator with XRE-family HTH domain